MLKWAEATNFGGQHVLFSIQRNPEPKSEGSWNPPVFQFWRSPPALGALGFQGCHWSFINLVIFSRPLLDLLSDS